MDSRFRGNDKGGEIMKTVIIAICIVALLAVTAHAEIQNSPVKKLGRGIANLLGGFLDEIPRQIARATDEGSVLTGSAIGFPVGIAKGLWRTAIGAYEVATFFLPIPERYEPIITDPEYPFQEEKEYQF